MNTKKLVMLGLMAALAYVVMFVGRVPIVMFLKYDPKDVIILLAGFIYGPVSVVAISVVVSFVEMFTTSDTGIIGLVMNILSTVSFAGIATAIYKKKHTIFGAVIGLVTGIAVMSVIMLLWNYLIVPLYMVDTTREQVAGMLVPVFLPFNLLKGGLNATLALLIYKPLVKALRASRLLPPQELQAAGGKGATVGVMVVSAVVLATCVLVILLFQGVL